jgi:nitrogen fixation protein FixH
MTKAEHDRSTGGKLTGRKVALIFLANFGVILGANVTLMVNAIDTFSGLVVPNSYVASQMFDANRKAQEALGWEVSLDYRSGAVYLAMQDAQGRTVRPAELRVVAGRTTTEAQDRVPELLATPEGYVAPVALDRGNWRVDISARADDGTTFVQYRSLFVSSDAS